MAAVAMAMAMGVMGVVVHLVMDTKMSADMDNTASTDTLTNLRAQEKILLRSMKDYARALAKVRKLIKTEQKALHKKEGADESNNT